MKMKKADAVWNLLVPASRMAILDQHQGEMNIPLMVVMGEKMPDSIAELADLLGVSKISAAGFVFLWSFENGVISKDMFDDLMA